MFEKLEKNSKSICPAILRISMLLKICYGIMVQFNISAHDLWDVSDWNNITIGTLGYIQYLYQFQVHRGMLHIILEPADDDLIAK